MYHSKDSHQAILQRSKRLLISWQFYGCLFITTCWRSVFPESVILQDRYNKKILILSIIVFDQNIEHYTSGNTNRVLRISDCSQSVIYAPPRALDPKHKLQRSAIECRPKRNAFISPHGRGRLNLNDLKELSLSQFIIFTHVRKKCAKNILMKMSFKFKTNTSFLL